MGLAAGAALAIERDVDVCPCFGGTPPEGGEPIPGDWLGCELATVGVLDDVLVDAGKLSARAESEVC